MRFKQTSKQEEQTGQNQKPQPAGDLERRFIGRVTRVGRGRGDAPSVVVGQPFCL